MGPLAKGFLRKVCGNFAESSRKLRFIAPGKGAGILRKFRGNLRKIFWNDPFPNDPISELLSFAESLSEGLRVSEKYFCGGSASLLLLATVLLHP